MEHSRNILPATTVTEQLEPIIKERISVRVQEDVTHVLARDVIKPTVIELTQPIHDVVRYLDIFS